MKEDDCFNCGDKVTECKCGETETFDNDNGPICPYCGELNRASDSDGLLYSESTTEYDCGYCCREFIVDVGITFSWSAKRMEESDGS